MNKYDEKYIFRLATIEDIDKIMYYFKRNWKEDHILATNKEFFCYEHVYNGKVNYMLAINKQTKEIDALQGFIKASLDKKCSDIWAVMWSAKVNKDSMPFLGIEVLKRLIKYTSCRSQIGVGANPNTTIPLVKRLLKHKVGKLNHYYKLGDLENYKIAVINDKNKITQSKAQKFVSKLIKLENIQEAEARYKFDINKECIPYKDSWYFNKRYFCHPIYEYLVWGIEKEHSNKFEAILVARKVEVNGSSVLRIVDYIGNKELICGLNDELRNMIIKNGYEYIDFYCYGFDDSIMKMGGFVLRDDNDVNIIPNYFEPFVQKNIDIWFNSTEEKNITICKADADQDRPSRL